MFFLYQKIIELPINMFEERIINGYTTYKNAIEIETGEV